MLKMELCPSCVGVCIFLILLFDDRHLFPELIFYFEPDQNFCSINNFDVVLGTVYSFSFALTSPAQFLECGSTAEQLG